MSRGNCIVVSANPKGHFVEGILGSGVTAYPGMVVQVDHSIEQIGGRNTWVLYNADADGGMPKGPYIILTEDALQGLTMETVLTAGARVRGYIPLAGDELNLLLANIAGTGDDHTAGEMLIVDDTTGKFIATTGSPESECAQLHETVTDPTADSLRYCTWTGH